jgi:uncharacterized protein YlzI (FlbEa/FlbD family)
MLELIAQDGAKLFVNPRAIWHIRSGGPDAAAIYTTSGAALFVRGNADEVAEKVNAWFKTGIDQVSSQPVD